MAVKVSRESAEIRRNKERVIIRKGGGTFFLGLCPKLFVGGGQES